MLRNMFKNTRYIDLYYEAIFLIIRATKYLRYMKVMGSTIFCNVKRDEKPFGDISHNQ